jgi:hypothetical protein
MVLVFLILSKAAGLARRVNDSGTLKPKFEGLVRAWTARPKDDRTDKSALVRRVSTRWNSDLTCLSTHVFFKTPVQQLTSDTSNKLDAYRFNDAQWKLAEQLIDVLEVCFLPSTTL